LSYSRFKLIILRNRGKSSLVPCTPFATISDERARQPESNRGERIVGGAPG